MHTIDRLLDEVAGRARLGAELGKPAYAYLRVSTEEQAAEEASGLPRQLERIVERAAAEGLFVPRDMVFLDDGFSGYEYHRPGINALLAEIESGRRRSDTVVIEDIDRLARDTDLQGFFFTILAKRHGMRLLFWKHPGSKLERLIRGYMSDEEMQRAKQRMKDGNERKARSGRVTARVPAYGYRFVDAHGSPSGDARRDTQYGLHPEHAPVVRMIFEKVVYENWSLFRLAQHLAELGVPSPRRWTGGSSGALGFRHWGRDVPCVLRSKHGTDLLPARPSATTRLRDGGEPAAHVFIGLLDVELLRRIA